MAKVFVLGGTGFLGYYTILELIERGYKVKQLSLTEAPAGNEFPDGVESIIGDLNKLSDQEIVDMLSDCDGVIYSGGADERIVPDKPAFKFFYQANVLPTQRFARLAAEAGVKDFVLFGSYTTEHLEKYPELTFNKQPYPMTRLLQEQVAMGEGEGSMTVSSLRLPYIFGDTKGRVPVWKIHTDMLKDKETVTVPAGGTSFLTVEQVAEAAVGAMERREHRATYAVATDNIKHLEFYEMILAALGQTGKTELVVRSFDELKESYEQLDVQIAQSGKEHGIHLVQSAMQNSMELFEDPTQTYSLGVKERDTRQSIKEVLDNIVKTYYVRDK